MSKSIKDLQLDYLIGKVNTGLDNKVTKVEGKDLSSNDFSDDMKEKLSSIAEGAEVNQNAFTAIKFNEIGILADNKNDIMHITSGNNISFNVDENTDSVVISANSIELDSSLTVEGMAADAKAVGNAINSLSTKDFVIQTEAPEDTSVLWVDINDSGSAGISTNTPVKGVDYWTESDKEEIIQDILNYLSIPVFGRVDAGNNIILSGSLPDGIYTLKYERLDGKSVEIGILDHKGYTNMFDINSEDYLRGYRLKSDGVSIVASGLTYTTNYIPCHTGDIIRVKGLNICWFKDSETDSHRVVRAHFYDENKAFVANIDAINGSGFLRVEEEAYVEHTVGNYTYTNEVGDVSSICYVRLCGILFEGYTEEDIVITINQEIT